MRSTPVVLVVPPFFPCRMPSLAAGILKAGLARADIQCSVFHANILFAEVIGLNQYDRITNHNFHNRQDLLGERLFAASAHGIVCNTDPQITGKPGYLKELHEIFSGADKPLSPEECAGLAADCADFVNKAASMIAALKPKIVGFSCSLQQINPSIALAQAIKKALPGVLCVVGGKNCDGVMGEELASSISAFDFVFQGEADFAFSSFCKAYLDNGALPRERLVMCETPLNLEQIPTPDHTDYMEQALPEIRRSACLTFESSRGCWWGQNNRCRFCADTGASIAYRSKSPERVVGELCALREKYPDVNTYLATDSIFPRTYFDDFFGKLSASGFSGNLTYEVKANLSFDQLSALGKAGISVIDPGIESLSTRLLRLLNKGCTAASNIRFLRDCRELGISPFWHLLVCIPGDKVSDYEEQIRLMPLIHHLQPPMMVPIMIQRFSPYFEDRKAHEVTDVRPVRGYEYAFPASVDISRLAYFFEADFPSEGRDRPEIMQALTRELIAWAGSRLKDGGPVLRVRCSGAGQWTVEDTRECASSRFTTLDADGHSLLVRCRTPQSRSRIKAGSLVDRLLGSGFLVEVDGKLLSVVCDSAP